MHEKDQHLQYQINVMRTIMKYIFLYYAFGNVNINNFVSYLTLNKSEVQFILSRQTKYEPEKKVISVQKVQQLSV
jgi:hypothetical protein